MASRGFTLVELLVVLLILSVLLVATPIAFDRILPGLEIEADARDLANLMRQARLRAIRTNDETTVVIDVEERAYWLGGGEAPEDFAGDLDAAAATESRGAFSEGVSVTLRTAESEQIGENVGRVRFFPDGTSTGGGVLLERRDRQLGIVVDWLYGHVRIDE
jgi:general secretion pathway protein H